MEQQEAMDREETKDPLEALEHKELEDRWDHVDHLVLQEPTDQLGYKDHVVWRVKSDLADLKDRKHLSVILDTREELGQQERSENPVKTEDLEDLDREELPEIEDQPVLQAPLVVPAFLE